MFDDDEFGDVNDVMLGRVVEPSSVDNAEGKSRFQVAFREFEKSVNKERACWDDYVTLYPSLVFPNGVDVDAFVALQVIEDLRGGKGVFCVYSEEERVEFSSAMVDRVFGVECVDAYQAYWCESANDCKQYSLGLDAAAFRAEDAVVRMSLVSEAYMLRHMMVAKCARKLELRLAEASYSMFEFRAL